MTYLMPDIAKLAPADGAILFYHSGYFSQAIIEASAEAIRSRLETADRDAKRRRRVLSAFIELAQNIVHYSADGLTDPQATADQVRVGTLRAMRTSAGVMLTCANPVTRAAAERLEAKMSALATMGPEELRRSYRAALRAKGEAESKGGGIGLLTLARESVEPMRFSIVEVAGAPDRKMFNLTVTV
jgi:Family of unknown function (DUF6272)